MDQRGSNLFLHTAESNGECAMEEQEDRTEAGVEITSSAPRVGGASRSLSAAKAWRELRRSGHGPRLSLGNS